MDFVGGTADQWWKLSARLQRALQEVSQRLDPEGRRFLKLGSAVLIGTPAGDLIRVPIILKGGSRELPVAYLRIERPDIDSARVDTLARRLEALAQPLLAGAANLSGQETEIIYP